LFKSNTLDLSSEIEYQFSRSGGKGGQNVNKVETKVQLRFHVPNSSVLSKEEKELIIKNAAHRITKDGEIVLRNQSTRSQLKNKTLVTAQFYHLIEKALKPQKKRKPTKMPKAVKRKRLENKKRLSIKKQHRRKGNWGD